MFPSKSLFFAVALAFAGAGTVSGTAGATPIPDDVKLGGFAVGAQAWTWHQNTTFEAIENAAFAGAKVIELFPGQRIKKDGKARLDPNTITDEQIAEVKEQLKKFGVRAVNFGVTGVPKDEAKARKIFEFAKKLDLYAISTESVDAVDTIEKLAKEYDINVGFHNHPRQTRNPNYKVWDPQFILELVKNRDPHLGAAADVGHWATDGIDAVASLKLLKGRVISVHIKDRTGKGVFNADPKLHKRKETENVPLGFGVIGIGAVLDELHAQGFKGNLSIEHESHWGKNVPKVAAGLGYVKGYGEAKHYCCGK